MNMTGNTILITGGSSGIGLELARQLAGDNTVIITGRDPARLEAARSRIDARRVHAIPSDASDSAAIRALYDRVTAEFPALNMLVNNAGIMRKLNLRDGVCDIDDLTREIETNLNGLVRMTGQFLPHLRRQKSAAIVNVSSGLAFVPFPLSPVYSATKAGVHAFTRALRFQLQSSSVKIFELAPPGTDTPLFTGEFDQQDVGSVKAMEVGKMVAAAIAGMKKDTLEIRPGVSNVLKILSRIAPDFALNMLGKSARASLDRMTQARA